MKYLSIKKCRINDGQPFFCIAAPVFKKHFRYNVVAEKLARFMNGEINSVMHNGNEYFLSKSVFTSTWSTPVYLVTVNDNPAPFGFFYAIKTEYIVPMQWRFTSSMIIEYDENVERYGYTEETY